uniref:Uncharacterized protein n=1 Tax=Aegilops tauschii subsp. strangulata TaxID=200361 RepID=A0A452ZJM7_AEGTS
FYLHTSRSDFLGTKFVMYDNQKPYDGAKSLKSRSSRRFATKQISPHVSATEHLQLLVSKKQSASMARPPAVLVLEFPRQGDRRLREELPARRPGRHQRSMGRRGRGDGDPPVR